MEYSAILHDMDKRFCYAIDKDLFVIRVQVKKDDIKEIILHYEDKYIPLGWKDTRKTISMKKVATSQFHDYYEAQLQMHLICLRYYFEFTDMQGEKVYYGNYEFSRECITNRDRMFDCPQNLREEEMFEVPEWAANKVVYQIFPSRFAASQPIDKELWYKAPITSKDNLHGDLRGIIDHLDHIQKLGIDVVYLTPIFKSDSCHKYDTTDYYQIDPSFGTTEDLKELVQKAHECGMKVVMDAVFNHTGRDFFAFKDIQKNREQSPYRDWYCNVNFYGNNEYNDGFSYDNWGGYNLLVKLNQWNPQVKDYIYDVIRFWVSEFDIDGIRLDAADVLDFDFMKGMRQVANEVKPDFWLMGEVIHGEYTRWVNSETLHSVTNYNLNKALWSGCNEHNFFEIAHTVKRLYDMGGCHYRNLELYSFADNHDVERIASKIINKDHLGVIYTLMYTLPGIPSIYYGSEFGIEGKKEQGSDASLRPHLELSDYADAMTDNPLTALIAKLGSIHQAQKALCYGEYKELLLTNRQYAFARCYENEDVITAVNNDEQSTTLHIPYQGPKTQFKGALSGKDYMVQNGSIEITLDACGGDILI